MRDSEAGRALYEWLDREVFSDVRSEVGIDLDKEADRITAFATGDEGAIAVVQGNISQETKDKLLALMALGDRLDKLGSKSRPYYYFAADNERQIVGDGDVQLRVDSFEDGMYLSFALKDRVIATSTEAQMQAMLANNGKLPAAGKPSGTLFVLSAEKSLMQAGLKPNALDAANIDWDSNLLRNTDQVAVMIADVAGKVAIEAQLVAREAEMAQSLASIARGLISLQMFSDEMDPEIAAVPQSTRVDVDDAKLSISVAFDPVRLVAMLDE